MSPVSNFSPFNSMENLTGIPPHDSVNIVNGIDGNPTRIDYLNKDKTVAVSFMEYSGGGIVKINRMDVVDVLQKDKYDEMVAVTQEDYFTNNGAFTFEPIPTFDRYTKVRVVSIRDLPIQKRDSRIIYMITADLGDGEIPIAVQQGSNQLWCPMTVFEIDFDDIDETKLFPWGGFEPFGSVESPFDFDPNLESPVVDNVTIPVNYDFSGNEIVFQVDNNTFPTPPIKSFAIFNVTAGRQFDNTVFEKIVTEPGYVSNIFNEQGGSLFEDPRLTEFVPRTTFFVSQVNSSPAQSGLSLRASNFQILPELPRNRPNKITVEISKAVRQTEPLLRTVYAITPAGPDPVFMKIGVSSDWEPAPTGSGLKNLDFESDYDFDSGKSVLVAFCTSSTGNISLSQMPFFVKNLFTVQNNSFGSFQMNNPKNMFAFLGESSSLSNESFSFSTFDTNRPSFETEYFEPLVTSWAKNKSSFNGICKGLYCKDPKQNLRRLPLDSESSSQSLASAFAYSNLAYYGIGEIEYVQELSNVNEFYSRFGFMFVHSSFNEPLTNWKITVFPPAMSPGIFPVFEGSLYNQPLDWLKLSPGISGIGYNVFALVNNAPFFDQNMTNLRFDNFLSIQINNTALSPKNYDNFLIWLAKHHTDFGKGTPFIVSAAGVKRTKASLEAIEIILDNGGSISDAGEI